jgi:hypothetical protein
MIQLKNALLTQINVREYRRDNQKWTIQKNGQHWAHKTKKNIFLQFFRLGIFELVTMETGICYKYFATFSIISYDTLKK